MRARFLVGGMEPRFTVLDELEVQRFRLNIGPGVEGQRVGALDVKFEI